MTSITSSFRITGMTCGHCARTVERAAASVAGVEQARVDLGRGLLTVTGNASPDAVARAVDASGYAAEAQ